MKQDEPSKITAEFIALEAARLVGGARAATHGDKTTNFLNIAELWNGYINIRRRTDSTFNTRNNPITALDVGNMFELLKIARRLLGDFNLDDYIDGAGYAACTGEIAAHEASNAKPAS